MAMSTGYLNAIADAGKALLTHVGLVDETGTEITGGTYARQAVTWGSASNGDVRLGGDETFNIPAGVTVGGWRGYSASTAGTDYGGGDLTQEEFVGAGTYTLTGASTGINHDAS